MKKILQKYSDSIIATLALIINRGLDAIILLVITPFLIKIFGVDNYGELSYYLAIIFFIQTFIIFGFENYIIYNTSNNKKNHSIILSSVMTIKITIFFILALIYIIFCVISYTGDSIFPYILLLLPFSECFNFSHYYVVKKIPTKLIKISIIRLLFYVILTLTLISNIKDIELYSLILSTSYLITVIIQNIYLKKEYNIKLYLVTNKKKYFLCFKDSFYFFLLRLFQILSDRLYLILSGIALSYIFVTYLDVAIKLYLVILMPVQLLVTSVLPKFITKNYNFSFKVYTIFILLLSLILIPLSFHFEKSINNYFFHTKDIGLNIYIYVCISAIVFISSFLISELYLNPIGKLKLSLIISFISFIIPFSISLILSLSGALSFELILTAFLASKILDFILKLSTYLYLKNMVRKKYV